MTAVVFCDLWVSGLMHKNNVVYLSCAILLKNLIPIMHFFPFIWVSKVVSESVQSFPFILNAVGPD